eukprot:TRINITY_DN628_c1_g1_i1.p1 TRINITY_DN628_c1_g1~~TRINITY_DN628_c1_g1_i1.p1  ORF type:complete len:571 (-),score=158.14 TRINITY_DN628_c1_g1_i1:865-2577(-)
MSLPDSDLDEHTPLLSATSSNQDQQQQQEEHAFAPTAAGDGMVRRQARGGGVWAKLGSFSFAGGRADGEDTVGRHNSVDGIAVGLSELEREGADHDELKPVAAWVNDLYSLPSLAIIMSYFSVGVVLTFTTVPVTVYLIQELGASSTQFTVYTIVCKLPWSFKVFFGFISDAFPISGMRRLPYLVIGWTVHIACYVMLAFLVRPTVEWVIGAAFVAACGYLLSDVMTDSIMVERTKLESTKHRGTVQASGYIARAFGSAVGSTAGALVYNQANWGWGLSIAQIMLINAVVPLACVSPFIPYLKETVKTSLPTARHVWRTHWQEIWALVQKRVVWQPMTFVYIYNAMMIPNAAWNNFLIEGLKFSDFYLGVIAIAGSVTAWLGLVLYKQFYMQTNWRSVYLVTTIFNLMVNIAQMLLILGWNKALGIPDIILAVGDEEFLLAMQFLPVVIMYAAICPEGTEGTSYAMLTTLSNVADTVALVIGDLLTEAWDTSNDSLANHEWGGMLKLTLFTSVMQLLPLLLLPLLPANKTEQHAMQRSNDSSWWGGFAFLSVTLGSIAFSMLQPLYEIYW